MLKNGRSSGCLLAVLCGVLLLCALYLFAWAALAFGSVYGDCLDLSDCGDGRGEAFMLVLLFGGVGFLGLLAFIVWAVRAIIRPMD